MPAAILRRFTALPFVPFLALVCLAVVPSALWAGPGFQPVSPEELKMTSEPQAPGAHAVILFHQVDRDDNSVDSHQDDYFRVKILTEEGREYANVEIPFFKGDQDVIHVHARTIRPDGSIVEFKGQVFEKAVVKARGQSYLVKAFILPDVQVGGIIEYFYTTDFKEHYIFDSNWILSQDLFTKNLSYSLKPFQHEGWTLRWTWHLLPPGASPKEGPDHIIRMMAQNVPAFQTEDYMPPANELKSRVDFIYSDELLERDTEKFWRSVGKKRNGALESFVGKRKAMEEAVAQTVSANDPPEVKLRKIYDRVQQIRNTSYEVAKTDQEQKRDKEKPVENVEELWKRGYGNGVQLTWLFLGMARAAGFEAYGCWVANRAEYFFDPAGMQDRKLDANVVLVKLNGQDVYFDPGGLYTPFGMLTWVETGTPGMKLDKEGGSWIHTTLPKSDESKIVREAKLTMSDTGDVEGKLTVTYSGLEAMYWRQRERHTDEVQRKKSLEDSLKEHIPAATELDLSNKPDWNASETPLVAEFSIKIPGWVASAGRRAVMSVGFFAENEKHVFEHGDRVHPIYFSYPYETLDDVTVELPAGWHVASVPAVQNNDGHIVQYSLKVDNNKDVLHLVRKINVDVLMLEVKYYPALRNFFQAVRSGDAEQVLLQPGPSVANN
jgi:hypothetical protein